MAKVLQRRNTSIRSARAYSDTFLENCQSLSDGLYSDAQVVQNLHVESGSLEIQEFMTNL